MLDKLRQDGVVAGRLGAEQLDRNFSDLHPRLTDHEAVVAADRCYFCHDAPCIQACPTDIDIPLFIRQIANGQEKAAARTIFEQNILGGMCARVCPTETLCEEACVREVAEGKPVLIGQLQRFATDALMADGAHPFTRAPATGKHIAVVGAGPAGLACAHRLAMKGHSVTIYEAKPKGGGLNEFGIAAYKTVDDFAQAEVDWLLGIGGITVEYGKALGPDLTLESLKSDHDAVFLSIGLGGVRALDVPGKDLDGVEPAVDFIADLRQAQDLGSMPVGRRVVVIGGGMTAVDAAVQSRLLGAEEVTIVYRRSQDRMSASRYEQDLATSHGVRIVTEAQPVAIIGESHVSGVDLAYTDPSTGSPQGSNGFSLVADQVLIAIGQTLASGLELDTTSGKIAIDASGATSVAGVWAGGDCAVGGDDLTVTAVAEGRDAAEEIHAALSAA